MNFSQRLKRLRNQHKLTQEQLGKKVNVTKVSISGYENGNRTPDMETLQRLAEVFNTSIDYLLGRSDNPSPKTEQTFEEWIGDPKTVIFFKDYLKAPEERKEELRRFWEFMKEREKGKK